MLLWMKSIKGWDFLLKWEKYFSISTHIFSNEKTRQSKIINSSCWCFSAWIVVPKEQHESWIQITTPKACKISLNEGEKIRMYSKRVCWVYYFRTVCLSQLPLKWHKSHENELWNHGKKMITVTLLCRQRHDKPW